MLKKAYKNKGELFGTVKHSLNQLIVSDIIGRNSQ